MAAIVGEAGGSALRRALLQAAALPVGLLTTGVIITPILSWSFARSDNPFLLAVACVVVSAGSFWFSRRDFLDAYELVVESRDWARGAAGERAAARDLELLPPEYIVFNDVHPGFRGRSARWNWDHVIIGPKGLFVVDSKNYAATRIRDGRSDARTRRNVKQVRNYALAFKREIVYLNAGLGHVFISPVLAYVNEEAWIERLREADVRVLPMRLLRKDILSGPDSSLPVGEAVKIANLLFNMYETHQQAEYRDTFKNWASHVRKSKWPQRASLRSVTAEEADAEKAGACPKCGAVLRLRRGKYGDFYGCSAYRKSGCTGKRALDGSSK